MTFIPVMGGFPLWFKKYRQLAPALVMTSGAIGIFIFAPVIQLLIDTYSWRGAVFVISGLVLQAAWVGASFFPAKLPESSKPAQAKNSPNPSLFNNLSFWLHLVHGFLIFGVPLFLIFIVRHVVEHRGFTAQEAAFLVSICGATSFFGRFLAVAITFNKRTGTKAVRFSLFNLASLFAAVASGLIPFLWDYRVIATVCATMGAMQGLKLSTMIGVTLDITTPPAFQTGYAFFHFVGGISIFAAPPLAGKLSNSSEPVIRFLNGSLQGHILTICNETSSLQVFWPKDTTVTIHAFIYRLLPYYCLILWAYLCTFLRRAKTRGERDWLLPWTCLIKMTIKVPDVATYDRIPILWRELPVRVNRKKEIILRLLEAVFWWMSLKNFSESLAEECRFRTKSLFWSK